MDNFLTRLAERSIASSTAVKPVTAPLFATGPHLASSTSSEVSIATRGAAADWDAVADTLPRARDLHHTSDAEGPAWDSTVPHAALRKTPDERGARAQPFGELANAANASAAGTDQDTSSHPIINGNRPGTAARERFAEPSMNVHADAPSAQAKIRVQAQPSRAENNSLSTPETASALAAGSNQNRQGERAQGERATLNTLPSVESSPPPVRITIGRVEVRAMFPATQAASTAAPPRQHQPLSLDEYLKQRNGGRR